MKQTFSSTGNQIEQFKDVHMLFATEADVVACYRLFLGRQPDPEGERSFLALIKNGGYPVTKLADLFLSSSEAQARLAIEKKNATRLELVQLPWGRIYVTPDWNEINRGIFETKAYEPHITKYLQATLRTGMTFVDIGANIGFFTLLAVSMGCKTFSFEPHTKNVWLMQRSLAENHFQAEIFPIALADSSRLLLYSPTQGNGQISELSESAPTDEQTILRTSSLDEVLAGQIPDLIKIDVEGAEGLVIKGAQRMLDHRPIVVSEFSASTMPRVSGTSPSGYMDEFVRRGYEFVLLDPDGRAVKQSANQLIDASLSSKTNLIDFVAIPS